MREWWSKAFGLCPEAQLYYLAYYFCCRRCKSLILGVLCVGSLPSGVLRRQGSHVRIVSGAPEKPSIIKGLRAQCASRCGAE